MKTGMINPLLIGALVFAGICGIRAPSLIEAIKSKSTVQAEQVRQLRNFRANVDAIRPIRATFEESFRLAVDVRDLVSLHRVIALEDIGLAVDKDALVLKSVEKAVLEGPGGGDLALTRICVTSGTGGLEVRAPTMEGLLAGIVKLTDRRDIEMTFYTVSIDDKTRVAKGSFKDFCLLTRS